MTNTNSILDYIEVYEGAIGRALCDKITTHYTNSPSWETSTFATNDGHAENSSDSVRMRQYWVENNEPYRTDLTKVYTDAVTDYIGKHSKIVPLVFTRFRLNWYGKGGFMKNHIDNIHHSHGQQYGYPHVTALGFLNDEYEGGDFSLCNGEMVIQPKKGDLIVFPSNFMYPHEVKPVTSGDRITCMTWIM